jgi:hypothetical protein
MIVTFYSYKGGVGRSMALVNVAEILVQRGYRVVVCDWDLEAPGLEAYLARNKAELLDFQSRPGNVDLLGGYKHIMSSSSLQSGGVGHDQNPTESAISRPSEYLATIPAGKGGVGTMRLLSAGRRGQGDVAGYAEKVQRFDWADFYDNWAGNSYIEFFGDDLRTNERADFVLVDSRTGITEQGGVCTHHLADIVVLLTGANAQHLSGTLWMAGALASRDLEEMRGGRPIHILSVAARIEQTSEKNELADFRKDFRETFHGYLSREVGSRTRYFLTAEIPYIPYYSFTERVAARESPDERHRGLFEAYAGLTDAIERIAGRGSLQPAPAASIFVSYAYEDRQWYMRLRAHLGWLEQSGAVAAFDDRQILVGDEWDQSIKRKLDEAEVIILIVTADFLASQYCATVELRRATERHGLGAATVMLLPIIATG